GDDNANLLNGEAGNDVLNGSLGADTLVGDLGADFLSGGDGNDLIQGGDGADRLLGSAGQDVMTGGAGADTFIFNTLADSRIGLRIARALLNHGMKVCIADVNPGHLDEARRLLAGSNAVHFIQVDVTDRAAMAAAADETEQVFGKVHLLCANAGVASGAGMDE